MVSYFLVCGFLADKWTSPQNDFAAGSAGLMSSMAVECCTENSRPRVDPIRTANSSLNPAPDQCSSHNDKLPFPQAPEGTLNPARGAD